MSTVDKMLIKGIRSFDPENKHVITFFKPLTLIVGPNGAGKTTVIECLKLSCTGELPPNARSGHSFIHDPKVAGETETKAQIKLRFKTSSGKDVVCIRSFQLTQKASKMEYKAIESVLQTINPHTGEKVCLSYRCADMDREIPALMGVSKAILENVIFVHQDDANWPLQDPSTLKKKFDDIFSATRYTKALEVIKKLHKDQGQEIKTYKLKLDNLQTLKDAAYKLRENISQDEGKTASVKSQIHDLERNVENVDACIYKEETTLKELRKLKEQIATKSAERSVLFKEQQKQYAALAEENEDTDEELREWNAKFEGKIALLESEIRKLMRNDEDIENRSLFLKHTINECIWEISRLQTESDAYEALKSERDLTIRQLISKHKLGSLRTTLTEDNALNLTNRLKKRSADLEANMEDKKKMNELELREAWNEVVSANDRWKDMEAQKQAKMVIKCGVINRIKQKEEEHDSFERQIANFNLSHIDERENYLKADVEKKASLIAEREFPRAIHKKQSEIFNIDPKIKALNRDRDLLAGDSEDRMKLSLRKVELENQKKKHKKIIDEYRDKIREVLKGRLPAEKDLKKEISQAHCKLVAELDELGGKGREAEKEVNMLQVKIQEAQSNLSRLNKEKEAKKRLIEKKLQSLEGEDSFVNSYLLALEAAREKRDIQKSKYNIADGMRQMFDPFERVARAHHICPCCERPFLAEEEDDFVKKQRVKSANSAEHMKLLAKDSSISDSHFQQLDKLRIHFEEYVKIGTDNIPVFEKNIKVLTEELDVKSQSLDDILGISAQIKAEKDAVGVLLQPIETADRILNDSQSLQKQVDDLEYRLDYRGQGVRTIEEIQLELSGLQTIRENLQSDVDRLRDEQLQMQEDLSHSQLRWHNEREEKIKVANILHDLKKTEEDLECLCEEKAQIDFDEQSLSEALSPLEREKERLERSHEQLKVKISGEWEELAEERRNHLQEVDALLKVSLKIKEYADSDKGERLKEMRRKQGEYNGEMQGMGRRKQEIVSELERSKDLMRNQDQLKRNIEDNLNYRKTKADVDRLARDVDSLEDRILNAGGFSSHEAEHSRLSQERERLLSELNRCRGTVSVYQSNVSKHKADLKQAQYKDIDRRYFDQLLQLKTTEMANKDLDRYYNALDKALMRFHTMKMEEINKIIRELWQQTYRGQDIDYIRIHSDSEGAGTRSYSYRVLMQSGDTELEMRGRCSAGQKVLASLIIRLALAETFCLHCGILALDEPTTNLDGPNAESLAAALLRIMEDRKGQENFQLIVITHDERFAQLIGRRHHAERYYRLSKDDHQHSIIEAQDILD